MNCGIFCKLNTLLLLVVVGSVGGSYFILEQQNRRNFHHLQDYLSHYHILTNTTLEGIGNFLNEKLKDKAGKDLSEHIKKRNRYYTDVMKRAHEGNIS